MKDTDYKSIDAYIKTFPSDVQKQLQSLRQTIAKAAPGAEEAFRYGIPTFRLNGNLVHFAGYDSHIGFYPGAGAIKNFGAELTSYKTSKGTVQFPIGKPLPLPLIRKIVAYRVSQNTKQV